MADSTQAQAGNGAGQWHRALALGELSAYGLHAAQVGGHNVVLLRVDGGLRAYRDACPHEGFSLSKHAQREDFVIVCNKHLWEFDAETGEHVSRVPRPQCNLTPYPVREADGFVEVFADADAARVDKALE